MTPYSPILATLGYVLSSDGDQVLMVHRNSRANDHHFGKWNGLGGKLHPDEDVVSGMKREIHEEANLEVTQLHLRGTVSWPGFGKRGEDWFGFLFVITEWSGSVPKSNSEGTLEWVNVAEVMGLSLWEGDRKFLPLVFAEDERQFHGVMPYANGRPVDWSVSFL